MFQLVNWLQAEVLVYFTLAILFGIPIIILIVYLAGIKKSKKGK